MKKRCAWCTDDPLYIDYHDNEWGIPVFDDRQLFEMLILEGMQAGLSWLTILKKREHYRKVFDDFNPEKIARYNEKKFNQLMQDPGIIRNRLKIAAIINNAQAYIQLLQQEKSFSDYLWKFVDNEPIQNTFRQLNDIPSETGESKKLARDLKQHHFKFVGGTIVYAFMQAVGMVNDHTTDCFRYKRFAS